MRLFVGIPVSADFSAVSEAVVSAGARRAPGPSHITLRFLGDVNAPHALEIVLDDGMNALPAVDAAIEGVGAFPNTREARVIWAGVDAPLERDAAAIAEATKRWGQPETRRFRPHVTLGRFRRPTDVRQLVASFEGHRFAQQRLERIVLYASHLTSAGPRYEEIAAWSLGRDG